MVEIKKLSNGLTVASEYLPYVQSVSAGIWVRAGAVDETPDIEGDNLHASRQPGISHFIEHMMFKGTSRRNAKELAEAIDRAGGSTNAFTGKEATCYYVKSLTENVLETVDVLTDMLTDSLFDPEEMEKEKNVVYEEMKMTEDSPEDLAHDLLEEAVFEHVPLGNRIIGTPESVASITRDDILHYLDERYQADNIVFGVAGNFDEDALIAKLEADFSDLKPGKSDRTHDAVDNPPSFLSKDKDIEQSHIYLGKPGVAFESEDYFTFMLYNSLLGGGMSSRLFQNIREEKGLAYSVYSVNASYVDDGFFYIYAGVGEDNEAPTIEAIREELDLLAREGIDEEELAKVKVHNKGQYIFNQENTGSRMFAAGRNMLLLGHTFTPEDIVGGINAVTREDIARIAARYASLDDYSAVIIGKNELSKSQVGL
jgi:predicted Zn-dependent peptidase